MTRINGLLITALIFIVFPSENGLCLWPNAPEQNDEMMFTNGDIYVQHLDASGTPLWTKGGIPFLIEEGRLKIEDCF